MAASFDSSILSFLTTDNEHIVGVLANAVANTGIQTQHSRQIKVWGQEIELLKKVFEEILAECDAAGHWHVVMEYELPRRQKRPDLIILADGAIFVIEFKFGAEVYDAGDLWQVAEYALNLRDFHAESLGHPIVPILCATEAPHRPSFVSVSPNGQVLPVQKANAKTLGRICVETFNAIQQKKRDSIEPLRWIESAYRPTLTIIEAAERLYESHDVREISHSYAENLTMTTELMTEVILDAKKNHKHCVCFITGVPGAGKTLTGLNVVHDPLIRSRQGPSGIFLSGNGPLVKIVREALVQNQMKKGRRRQQCEHEVSTFIQNVHSFLRFHLEHPDALPHEHVVVFDEAQRAWNRTQMNRKNSVDSSEPTLLLEVMERWDDWAVVIALVGGGQEIFLGEAGLAEWGQALINAKKGWSAVASPEVLEGGASVAGQRLFEGGVPAMMEFRESEHAHLRVSVRSHRAQRIAEWVNDLLIPDPCAARKNIPNIREFPLVVTRDLEVARSWLRARSESDPNRRCGLVGTSEDQRFRAYGLENSTAFRMDYPYEKWFLAPASDIRSSFALEVSATEFECQGLELDWVGVCWGGDLTPLEDGGKWEYRKFRGAVWQRCRQIEEQTFIRNRYRVLLTRARQGMIIWIPQGSKEDPTREPERFNRLYQLIRSAGVPDADECGEFET